MTVIELETEIKAGILSCFDLARSVDIHLQSTQKTREIVVAGRASGFCEQGDKITWEATHFGIRQRLSVEITKLEKPAFFEDRMTRGAFKSMRHEHHFNEINGITIMRDRFEYEVPLGWLGQLFDKLILKRYMVLLSSLRSGVIIDH
jgi:ligand-binding SRPBCC domain-containing protein